MKTIPKRSDLFTTQTHPNLQSEMSEMLEMKNLLNSKMTFLTKSLTNDVYSFVYRNSPQEVDDLNVLNLENNLFGTNRTFCQFSMGFRELSHALEADIKGVVQVLGKFSFTKGLAVFVTEGIVENFIRLNELMLKREQHCQGIMTEIQRSVVNGKGMFAKRSTQTNLCTKCQNLILKEKVKSAKEAMSLGGKGIYDFYKRHLEERLQDDGEEVGASYIGEVYDRVGRGKMKRVGRTVGGLMGGNGGKEKEDGSVGEQIMMTEQSMRYNMDRLQSNLQQRKYDIMACLMQMGQFSTQISSLTQTAKQPPIPRSPLLHPSLPLSLQPPPMLPPPFNYQQFTFTIGSHFHKQVKAIQSQLLRIRTKYSSLIGSRFERCDEKEVQCDLVEGGCQGQVGSEKGMVGRLGRRYDGGSGNSSTHTANINSTTNNHQQQPNHPPPATNKQNKQNINQTNQTFTTTTNTTTANNITKKPSTLTLHPLLNHKPNNNKQNPSTTSERHSSVLSGQIGDGSGDGDGGVHGECGDGQGMGEGGERLVITSKVIEVWFSYCQQQGQHNRDNHYTNNNINNMKSPPSINTINQHKPNPRYPQHRLHTLPPTHTQNALNTSPNNEPNPDTTNQPLSHHPPLPSPIKRPKLHKVKSQQDSVKFSYFQTQGQRGNDRQRKQYGRAVVEAGGEKDRRIRRYLSGWEGVDAKKEERGDGEDVGLNGRQKEKAPSSTKRPLIPSTTTKKQKPTKTLSLPLTKKPHSLQPLKPQQPTKLPSLSHHERLLSHYKKANQPIQTLQKTQKSTLLAKKRRKKRHFSQEEIGAGGKGSMTMSLGGRFVSDWKVGKGNGVSGVGGKNKGKKEYIIDFIPKVEEEDVVQGDGYLNQRKKEEQEHRQLLDDHIENLFIKHQSINPKNPLTPLSLPFTLTKLTPPQITLSLKLYTIMAALKSTNLPFYTTLRNKLQQEYEKRRRIKTNCDDDEEGKNRVKVGCHLPLCLRKGDGAWMGFDGGRYQQQSLLIGQIDHNNNNNKGSPTTAINDNPSNQHSFSTDKSQQQQQQLRNTLSTTQNDTQHPSQAIDFPHQNQTQSQSSELRKIINFMIVQHRMRCCGEGGECRHLGQFCEVLGRWVRGG